MIDEDVPTILQEFVQPRVISQDMLMNLIIDQGPKGEADILKIDHLWVVPNLVKLKLSNNIIEKIENLDYLVNLKELDLSFNRISIIENLHNLTKLEILLLFNNEISTVQGIDSLFNLTIFSIGNNVITDWDHVMYLRKFKKLQSLNMHGNPCTEKDGYLEYVFAFIPQLIYYQYKMITNEQRDAAIEKHYRALCTLQEKEAKEDEELLAQKQYEEKLAYHTSAFVEYLDGELFYQMFADDKEGKDLSMVNEDTQNAYEEYKINFTAISQELCEIGLAENEKRKNEIDIFTDCVNKGKTASQDRGRVIVNGVLEKKSNILSTIKQLLKKLVGDVDSATLDDITQKAHQLSEDFNDMVIDAWTKLMSIEVELHEQMEDVNEVLRINLSDMVDAFLQSIRGYFSQLRNSESEYHDTINGVILYFLSGLDDDAKVPVHMLNLCEDKDTLNYNLTNSHEKHLQVLDAREDLMLNRIRNWLEEYSGQLVKNENERNNHQILEISHFADSQQQEFLHLLQQLNLNVDDSEVILALGSEII
ncbi:dynein regulatory complex subunit 3 isoform X2 [Megachile rotundata]|uniref:dynein regulatory complex subunit 3 isoform X2 n=1 Tax=Megachile rotundata TaxID=143995 RepID=UPI003FCFA41F